ncbi:uncharacterized protein LOC144650566 isoform X1 [Oculina patagonica]
MNSCMILGLSLLALAQQTKAISQCPVNVTFIMDSSECISPANFKREKNFVKQAALKLGVATGQSRAAIIKLSRSVSVKAELRQYPSKQEFERAVDGLSQEFPRAPSYTVRTQIDLALNEAAQEVFAKSATSTRRIVILLTDGKQVIAAKEKPDMEIASMNLRKLGVRLLVVTMGTSSYALDKMLKLVTERDEDVVTADHFGDLLNKLPRMIACGSCVCTSGNSYITINDFQSKKKRKVDDIRFEFKSHMTRPGVIMSAQGSFVDRMYVGYKDERLGYNINLGGGERRIQSNQQLNNGWHKVHIARNEQSVKINIVGADDESSTPAIIPGKGNSLDIPSSKAYFLGAPESKNMPPNFVGCIRYFTVDGYEPIVNAWAGSQGSSIVNQGSMRPCTASDEMQS